jgi:hypothetical protein
MQRATRSTQTLKLGKWNCNKSSVDGDIFGLREGGGGGGPLE